jgi:hypothetical protein
MQTDLATDRDGQRTQVGPDPLDYVLRYAAGDYDCYHQGRYIGSRATLSKAIEAVEYEQAKAARHPQPTPADNIPIAIYQGELHAIVARLHQLAKGLASYPVEQASMRPQLIMIHIRISYAIKNLQDAERSCALAERAPALAAPLDAAA